jgi:hypothetical protein
MQQMLKPIANTHSQDVLCLLCVSHILLVLFSVYFVLLAQPCAAVAAQPHSHIFSIQQDTAKLKCAAAAGQEGILLGVPKKTIKRQMTSKPLASKRKAVPKRAEAAETSQEFETGKTGEQELQSVKRQTTSRLSSHKGKEKAISHDKRHAKRPRANSSPHYLSSDFELANQQKLHVGGPRTHQDRLHKHNRALSP